MHVQIETRRFGFLDACAMAAGSTPAREHTELTHHHHRAAPAALLKRAVEEDEKLSFSESRDERSRREPNLILRTELFYSRALFAMYLITPFWPTIRVLGI